MADIQQQIADDVTDRQDNIRARLKELEAIPEDDPGYAAVFNRLVEAADALLTYEAQIPARLEEPHRQASATAIRWAAGLHLAGAGALALTPFTGQISWWWLILAVIQALFGVTAASADPAPEAHGRFRYAAGILTVVTVLVPLLVFDVLTGWLWLAAIAGWITSFALTVPDAPTGTSRKERT
ncbi:hypothetical protein GCM10017744_102520 [Streptomyces antimycoticus]|uniref:Uncharacterized protein n=1 Tax=Streptomyces antimycoticus TaxID=68175 RepID=A0A4D4KK04_9ACTN|nr:hypothetical protein [Streptomyces antimycoticus]GDY49285.1 hypothetical protein SANT12839_101670 [Streptomyces antimycoticus]